jgi:hypothetical protein
MRLSFSPPFSKVPGLDHLVKWLEHFLLHPERKMFVNFACPEDKLVEKKSVLM